MATVSRLSSVVAMTIMIRLPTMMAIPPTPSPKVLKRRNDLLNRSIDGFFDHFVVCLAALGVVLR